MSSAGSRLTAFGLVQQAFTAADVVRNDRIYTPLITLWIFLGQVLSADHSCRAAVARLIAHRMSRGLKPCSPETGAYCQARKRLPEKFFATICRMVGRALDAQVERKWLWSGRRVYMHDGTIVRMPDTAANLNPTIFDENRSRKCSRYRQLQSPPKKAEESTSYFGVRS